MVPISVPIQPSCWMVLYLIGLHSLVIVALFIMLSGLLQYMAVIVLVLCSFAYSYWRYATERSGQWVNCITFRDQRWYLSTGNGQCNACLQQATVWRWLLVMNFYCEQTACHYRVLLLPDNCNSDQLRRLRVAVRHLSVWQR